MAKKQLKIKLLPTGEIQMETVGVKGKKCLEYIPMLEKLADVKIVEQKYTQEYYEQEDISYSVDEDVQQLRYE